MSSGPPARRQQGAVHGSSNGAATARANVEWGVLPVAG